MGVRIITEERGFAVSALYDSVSDVAFGPVFYGLSADEAGMDYDVDSEEMAEGFLRYLTRDARTYTPADLAAEYGNFLREIEEHGWEVVGEGVAS